MDNYTVEMKLNKILTPQEVEEAIKNGTYKGDNRLYDMVVRRNGNLFALEPGRPATVFENLPDTKAFIEEVVKRKGEDISELGSVIFFEKNSNRAKEFYFPNSITDKVEEVVIRPLSISPENIQKYCDYQETYTPKEIFTQRIEQYREKRLNNLVQNELVNNDYTVSSEHHYQIALNQYEKDISKALIKNVLNNDASFSIKTMESVIKNNTQSNAGTIKIPESSYNEDSFNMLMYLENTQQYNLLMSHSENRTKEIHLPRNFLRHTKNYETFEAFGINSTLTTGQYIAHYKELGQLTQEDITSEGIKEAGYGKATPIYSSESNVQMAYDIAYRQMMNCHKEELATMTADNQDLILAKHKFESALFEYESKNILKSEEEKDDLETLHSLYIDFQEKNLDKKYVDYTSFVKKPEFIQSGQTPSLPQQAPTDEPTQSIKPLQLDSDEYEGTVVDFGSAPYQHKNDASESFFVTLEKNGERATRWGVGIRDAFTQNEVQVGDYINLKKVGENPVLVMDDNGNPLPGAKRNEWVIKFSQPEDIPERSLRQGMFHYEGTVKEIGMAPYKGIEGAEPQPFIILENNGKTVTQWGRGIQDMVEKSGVKVGDYIDLKKDTDSTKSYNEWTATRLEQPHSEKGNVVEKMKKLRDGQASSSLHQQWLAKLKEEEKVALVKPKLESTESNKSTDKNVAVLRMKKLRN